MMMLLALFLTEALLLALYAASEHAFPFWDYGLYAEMAMRWHALPEGTWRAFAQSFSQNYNLLYALPSWLAFSVFGSSRLVFLETILLVYAVPCQLALGQLAAKLFKIEGKNAWLWGAGALALTPVFWFPLVEGYPDFAALACLLFALCLLVERPKTVRHAFSIGALLGFAVVFRRHYVYAVAASLGAAFVMDLVRGKKSERTLELFALMGGISVGVVALMEPDYFHQMLTVDFTALYHSYVKPPRSFLLFALDRAGGLFALVSLCGWGFALWGARGAARRAEVLFIPGLTVLWIALWCMGPSQNGEHFLLAIFPLFWSLGLVALFVGVDKKKRSRVLTLLLFNMMWSLGYAPEISFPSEPPQIRLFSAPRPPWVRRDYDELVRLARTLRDDTTEQERILVVGSSFTFNHDLLRLVFQNELHDLAPLRRFLYAPEIDEGDVTSYDVLAQADVFVVADPPQLHLPPEGQRNIASLAALFPPMKEFTAFFEPFGPSFTLERGVKVRLWRVKNMTPAARTALLSQALKSRGVPRDWVITGPTAQVQAVRSASGHDSFGAVFTPWAQTLRLAKIMPVAVGRYQLALTFNQSDNCALPGMILRFWSPEGGLLKEESFAPYSSPSAFYHPFSVEGKRSAYLTLDISSKEGGLCTRTIEDLSLAQLPPP